MTLPSQNCPFYIQRIREFDGLEVSPCHVVGHCASGDLIEVCDDPAKAHFWSVYGHYRPTRARGFGGVDCFQDFPTEAEARAFAAWLFSTFPHLRFGGRP